MVSHVAQVSTNWLLKFQLWRAFNCESVRVMHMAWNVMHVVHAVGYLYMNTTGMHVSLHRTWSDNRKQPA